MGIKIEAGHLLEATYAKYVDFGIHAPNQKLLYDISKDGKFLAYAVYGEQKTVTEIVDFNTKDVYQTIPGWVEFFVENGVINWREKGLEKQDQIHFETGMINKCGLANTNTLSVYKLLASTNDLAVMQLSHRGYSHIELWNLSTCQVKEVISFNAAEQALFSPNGRWLATSDGLNVHVWDVKTGNLHFSVTGEAFGNPKNVALFNADSTLFLTSTLGVPSYSPGYYPNYDVDIFDVATGRLIRTIRPPSKYLEGMTITTDNEIILIRDSAGLNFWKISTGQILSTIPAGPYIFSSTSGYIWVVPQQRDIQPNILKVFLYDYRTGKIQKEILIAHAVWVRALDIDASAKKMAIHVFLGHDENYLNQGDAFYVVDLETDNVVFFNKLSHHLDHFEASNGAIFATGNFFGENNYVHIWSFDSDTPYLTIAGESGKYSQQVNDNRGVTSFSYGDDLFFLGDIIVIYDDINKTIRFWDATNGHLLSEIKTNFSFQNINYSPFNFSPDQTLIAVVGSDGIIRLWGMPRKP